ncbi:unnamed protein product [Acanthosepion pharaonis]|uniref:Uncharacterized protein n=1 Tax=Acanthosepion pharaonis TaxID=158019 RepID=A0A812BXA8_ACAPH|nr:unnamed protein product [Sepia pharaonis]
MTSQSYLQSPGESMVDPYGQPWIWSPRYSIPPCPKLFLSTEAARGLAKWVLNQLARVSLAKRNPSCLLPSPLNTRFCLSLRSYGSSRKPGAGYEVIGKLIAWPNLGRSLQWWWQNIDPPNSFHLAWVPLTIIARGVQPIPPTPLKFNLGLFPLSLSPDETCPLKCQI